MDAAEALSGTPATDEAGKPVRLVLLGYLAAVLLPLIGIAAGVLIAATRPAGWARKQGLLIIALSAVLITLGVGLAPMLADSFFAAKAQRELNAISQETERADEESVRQMEAEQAKSRREEAATLAHIRNLQEGSRR